MNASACRASLEWSWMCSVSAMSSLTARSCSYSDSIKLRTRCWRRRQT